MPLQMQAIPEAENNSFARYNFLPVSWQVKKRIWVSMLKNHCYQSRHHMTASLWIPAQYIASCIPVDFMHHHLYPTEAIHAEESLGHMKPPEEISFIYTTGPASKKSILCLASIHEKPLNICTTCKYHTIQLPQPGSTWLEHRSTCLLQLQCPLIIKSGGGLIHLQFAVSLHVLLCPSIQL